MPVVGWRSPGSYNNNGWTWPQYALAYDSWLSFAYGGFDTIDLLNYGFSSALVPDDAIIQAVELSMRWYKGDGRNMMTASVNGGTGHACSRTSLGEDVYDITSEREWTPADLRDGVLHVYLASTWVSDYVFVDCARIRVTYSMPTNMLMLF